MEEHHGLATRFEAHRPHLRAVAYRMLGNQAEADDAVQEAWLRLSRSDTSDVRNLAGWLTTVVARVCLDMLRSRESRHEEPWTLELSESPDVMDDEPAPDHELMLADAIGPALLVVLGTLSPAERLAFVLHDMFGVSFEEIAPIVGRSPAAARQLASRARRRVQGAPKAAERDPSRKREIVQAFLAASRDGNFEALLALLDPDVVLRADDAAVAIGAAKEVRGARAVAETFCGRARGAKAALIDGAPGAVWAQGGTPRVVFGMTIEGGKIVEIALIADAERLGLLELTILDS